MSSKIKCDMCDFLVKPELYFAHVKSNHNLTTKFYAKCPLPGCLTICHLYSSFYRHWYKCRKIKSIVLNNADGPDSESGN